MDITPIALSEPPFLLRNLRLLPEVRNEFEKPCYVPSEHRRSCRKRYRVDYY
jgi:hypothetical protein